MEKNKAFKYRIYPDTEQRVLLAKTFGCVRFTYNHCLEEQERRYQNGEKYASRTDMNNFCNQTLKEKFPFLKEVDKFSLTNLTPAGTYSTCLALRVLNFTARGSSMTDAV